MVRKIVSLVGALVVLGSIGCAAEAEESDESRGAVGVERTPEQQAAAKAELERQAAERMRKEAEELAKADRALLAQYRIQFKQESTLSPAQGYEGARRTFIRATYERAFTCALEHPVQAAGNDYIIQVGSTYTFASFAFEKENEELVFRLVDETKAGYPEPSKLLVRCKHESRGGGAMLAVRAVIDHWLGAEEWMGGGTLARKK